MARSLAAGRRVPLPHVGLFADGVAVRQVGKETFRLCQELVDEIVLVDTDAICAAIKDVFEDTRSILEPAGALRSRASRPGSSASAPADRTLVAIACGANMNFDRLRFVAERAELGEEREAILAVTIPERPGSFREFCELLGKRSITEFNYRYADPTIAHLFVGVEVANRRETEQAPCGAAAAAHRRLRSVRQRDGQAARAPPGRRPRARRPNDEILYRFEFPERPGALMQLPRQHEPRLEHQPVPLPQPRRRLRAGAGRHAGAARRQGRVPPLSRPPRLRLRRRDRPTPPTGCSSAADAPRRDVPAALAAVPARHRGSVPARKSCRSCCVLATNRRSSPIPASFML